MFSRQDLPPTLRIAGHTCFHYYDFHRYEKGCEMKFHNPTCDARPEVYAIAARTSVLDGQTWGFVDTSKVNADLFIAAMKAEVERRYRPKDFVMVRKASPGFPLSEAQSQQLAAGCDVVVFCFGD